MQFTHPLKAGDKVALLSPASPFADGALLQKSVGALKDIGLVPVLFESAEGAEKGYLAASDEVRARDINRAFADEEIRAVFCTRGGYGCMRILPLLDYETAKKNPKMLIGLSDITALHLALYHKADLSTVHAPMPFRYPELPDAAKARLFSVLFTQGEAHYTKHEGLFSIHKGCVTAPMIGGNLTLVASLAASEYFPNTDGHILFLEEVGEEEYRIDRLMTALKPTGVFERVAGVVFGGYTDCGREEKIRAILADCVPAHIPTLGGFPAGHLQNNHAFFQGQTVTLDTETCTLHFSPIQRF